MPSLHPISFESSLSSCTSTETSDCSVRLLIPLSQWAEEIHLGVLISVLRVNLRSDLLKSDSSSDSSSQSAQARTVLHNHSVQQVFKLGLFDEVEA